jgi:1-acyl-sn-glycerol-3-phosphate acyltransferase
MMTFFQVLPGPVQGALSLLALFLNTLLWTTPLFIATFIKMIVPVESWRRYWGRFLDRIATYWVFCNNLVIRLTKPVKWEVSGLSGLDEKDWYLVVSNHQSWLDIVVLQKVLYRKIPFIKFFLKKELIWVPLLGQAWWALDFPFMKRYSREYLKKYPERKGKDLETTRKACAKFKHIPVAIMNFVEGTRFTRAKAEKQASPYTGLLKPKAAGIAFVLGAMGENLSSILNVTISYPDDAKSLWKFMCGRVRRIRVVVENIPITPDLLGDYFRDMEFQQRFQAWLNEMWERKEMLIRTMADPRSAGL